ncbi:hypothetical protein ABB37_01313 [Leptomonas pyrrhocoris]|uniref:Uncharacterized protein n=1 Tax=Leptomonas pyrrhocoris TaxID=157538 RepID=A0A0M9G8I5_LEPPY|nr:hypothetical protein ABB37_01313 [Leptomonas pyrrhocoris]XP_015663282.1 hypothetical protein ABB37_01313 [Leptomonas pyrrhocoris]XP_015663283.1 hypothetical protein ABB37_01313 [Leptomonas pyrrhocoris]KPA84842.1 hypothetical protein ABB37_01313 [Leptomonas pyrrhocoris]KPA84843.1 hypothetical protein ABB37_01313 [Leptomonas pyrrhocoris]KPA84844.1 hypothetical protein ABB37_01313 [Leptomonas pyrrhocoris]|eukprot:XP_015663281.1 hypothetical protein ABB37_01313 [Leptomonas pyrrhocoris]
MSGTDGKEDKYEQLLAKIDWHAPHPPKGYQFGAGRGAKGFVTTAELTTAGTTGAKMTREENDFFSAMERMEERKKVPKKTKGEDDDEDKDGEKKKGLHTTSTAGSAAGAAVRVKLSLDDLAALEMPFASSSAQTAVSSRGSAAAPDPTTTGAESDVAAPAPTMAAPSASSLVVRSARTEEGDAAEEHIFADERVLTPYDVLKGKASAVQAGLHNVLTMGSTEEQTTWITHARAYREMGMTRRAYQTLVEGCAVTGTKGKRIWAERLRYLSRDNVAGRRRLLDEATSACPSEEELWTQLLDVVPPLERVPCLQRAVLACPSSEHLWLRLVQFVPSVQDQRVLLQKALQHTPHLPLLWARLARLESYKTGKEMFQAAAARFPSLALIIEAAKYVEWYALSRWATTPHPETQAFEEEQLPQSVAVENGGGDAPSLSEREEEAAQVYRVLRSADSEVGNLVRTAQQNYLNLGEAGSRHAWLSMALSLLRSESKGSAYPEAETKEEGNDVAGRPTATTTKTGSYVCTAAQMFLSVVDPNHKGLSANAVPTTWLSDLTALFPAEAVAQHEVQCALWYTWVLLQRQYLDDVVKKGSASGNASAALCSTLLFPSATAVSKTNAKESFAVLEAAFLSAPPTAVLTELPLLLRRVSCDFTAEEENTFNAARYGPANAIPKTEEEEVEELRRPATSAVAGPVPSASLSPSVRAQHLPPSLIVTVAATLGLSARATAIVAASTTSSPAAALPQSLSPFLETVLVEVPLTLSEALYRRGCYATALAVVDLMLRSGSSRPASDGVLEDAAVLSTPHTGSTTPADEPPYLLLSDLRLHIARAKLLAAVDDSAAADRCLLEAINTAASHRNRHSSNYHLLQEETWVKLAVLRRSQGQPIQSILQDALQQCPKSWKLWLMLLEEKRRDIDAHQRRLRASLSATKHSGGATAPRLTTADMLRMDDTFTSEVREISVLCKKAVSADHCRTVAAVWIFAAQRVEAEFLQNVPAARALLSDAASACAASVYSTRSQLLARALSPQELEKQASALAQIGVAQAKLEAQYGTPGQALETVQEVLQKLPKTRDGTIAMTQDDAVGELLSLFISLEPPASRGRAAAQVMRQWKSREPLALCAVAQLYFTAGQYARALDQALKAVQASKGRCGDAVGLLWRMADQPAMQPFVRRQLYGSEGDDDAEEDGGTKEKTALTEDARRGDVGAEAVQQWVLSVMVSSAAAGGVSEEKRAWSPSATSAAVASGALLVVPKSGPLWLAVAKIEDPTNVTIRGYRRPVVEMLREVANRIDLKGHESGVAAPLRTQREG